MQGIILCPKCRVPVKRDDLGELLCPSCNARVCPKAHIFSGKICPHCGWEDPNYQLWQKEQQQSQKKSPESVKSGESAQASLQYTCPQCGSTVDATHKRCPNCGLLGVQHRPVRATATSASTTAASPTGSVSPLLDKKAFDTPKKQSVTKTRSPLLRDILKAERRQWEFPSWEFPSPKRFARRVLSSLFLRRILGILLVGLVLGGLVWGGIYIARLISQSFEPGAQPLIPHITQPKTYTLSTNIVPSTGGDINIISPSSSNGMFESGSQVTLMAIAYDCYTFSYWDGVSSSSETATITMDSDKSVTAHFQPKDTTPPAISDINTSFSDISATVTWETDKPTTYQINYGMTQDCDLTGPQSKERTNSHSARLSTLKANTKYYFKIRALDACGNETTHAETLITLRKIPVGNIIGNRAPDFTLPAYQDSNPESPNKGQTVSLSDFQGKKVLLNFWATSCGPCLSEFPFIRELYQGTQSNKNNGTIAVITIGIDNRPDRIKLVENKYKDEYGYFTFPMLLDVEGEAKKSYGIWKIPTTFLIDSDGIIREIKLGRFTSKEEMESILKTLD